MSKVIRGHFATAALRRWIDSDCGGMGEDIAALRREIDRAPGKVDR